MRHYYNITKYDANLNFHVCVDKENLPFNLNLLIVGDFPEDTKPESLVGKKISCSYTFPFISIAIDVKLEHQKE